MSREPAATERELAGRRTYGTGCALRAALAGVACPAVVWAVSLAMS
ncbi:hypothetical protein AB0H28_24905 [Micromonospora sp. NPDC050980]